MCVCVYIYTYIHTRMCTYTNPLLTIENGQRTVEVRFLALEASLCVCIHVCMYVCMHVCVNIRMYGLKSAIRFLVLRACACVCICTRVYMYASKCLRIYALVCNC